MLCEGALGACLSPHQASYPLRGAAGFRKIGVVLEITFLYKNAHSKVHSTPH